MTYKIRIEDVRKQFEGVTVLDGITLDVESGELVSIVGPSGCGKTTLLAIISRLISPDSGSIEAPADTGLMFQDPRLLRWRTAKGNIRLGADLQGGTVDDDRIAELLSLVHMEGLADAYPTRLSGGEKQRIALARTLSVDPEVLLMDEPLSALDERTRDSLQETVLDIHERLGKTTVFVTHSVDEAVKMGERVVVLSGKPTTIAGTVGGTDRDDAEAEVRALMAGDG